MSFLASAAGIAFEIRYVLILPHVSNVTSKLRTSEMVQFEVHRLGSKLGSILLFFLDGAL